MRWKKKFRSFVALAGTAHCLDGLRWMGLCESRLARKYCTHTSAARDYHYTDARPASSYGYSNKREVRFCCVVCFSLVQAMFPFQRSFSLFSLAWCGERIVLTQLKEILVTTSFTPNSAMGGAQCCHIYRNPYLKIYGFCFQFFYLENPDLNFNRRLSKKLTPSN